MKKFIHTWLGIGIFNESWYENRVKLFENITLKTFKQGQFRSDVYWIIYLDSDIPIDIYRRIYKLTRNVNVNVEIKQIKFYYEMVPDFTKTIRNICDSDDEFCLQMRLDADDSLNLECLSLFEENWDRKNTMLISFEDLYYLRLNDLKYSRFIRPFMALNMCFITNDKSKTIFVAPHNKMNEWAQNTNVTVKQIKYEKAYFIRTLFPDQDSDAFGYFDESRVEYEKIDENKSLLEDFNIDAKVLEDALLKYDFEEKFHYKWDYKSDLVRKSFSLFNKISKNKKNYLNFREIDPYYYKIREQVDIDSFFATLQEFKKDKIKIIISGFDDSSTSYYCYREFFEEFGFVTNLRRKYDFRNPIIMTYIDNKFDSIKGNNENKNISIVVDNLKINSHGYSELSKGKCSLLVDGIEYISNKRGLNIWVLTENNIVIDQVNIDTFLEKQQLNRVNI